ASYETMVLDYASTMKAAPYLAINPMGKVPAIAHEGRVVTECAAICAYLAEAFPDAGLAPTVAERADYYRWLFFAAGPGEAGLSNHAAGFDPSPEKARMFGYGSYDLMVDVLEQAVAVHDYVAGDRFTAADVYVGSQVAWGTQFGTLPKRDAFTAYLGRIVDRPACMRARDLDDALMPQPA
ncbi:MAG: glutathione S-transferase N-terminal domain-containing protein, partial [Pseudomonadota bacterium]|nr:glutathione S-transferase N-terminal domain-containing protein [Pseudomonadota bacterium]